MERFLAVVGLWLMLTHHVRADGRCGFLLTAPKALLSGSEERMCVTLHDVTADMDMTVRLLDGQRRLRTETVHFTGGVGKCFPFTVPSGQETGRMTLSVEGHTADGSCSMTGKETVGISVPKALVYIQTDKPVYKPGQTVQIRILSLKTDLKPNDVPIPLVVVKDASGSRVMQWTNQTTSRGLLSLSLPLATEPRLGDWKLQVQLLGTEKVQSFKVDEYVLPKFEVSVKMPTYVMVNDQKIEGEVCAKYTYGKPVKGKATVKVCVKQDYYSSERRPCANLLKMVNGCAKFTVSSTELELDSSRWSLWGATIVADAVVTEDATGISLNSSSTPTKVERTPIKINLHEWSTDYFKPGLPFVGKGKVTKPDGSPAPGETVIVMENRNRQNQQTYTTDNNGFFVYNLPPKGKNVAEYSITAKAPAYETQRLVGRYVPTQPTAFHQVKSWYSPSGSFLQVRLPEDTVSCGMTLKADVMYTTAANTRFTFYYQVMSRGNIIWSGHKTHHFAEGRGHTSDPARQPAPVDDPTSIPPPADSRPRRAQRSIMPRPDPPRPEEVEMPRLPHVGHFSIAIPVSAEMSPAPKLLVYYIRPDGETVADGTSFSVPECFSNDVRLRFSSGQLRPGQRVNLELDADAQSVCALGVVDKSVHLLGGNNKLTKDRVFSSLKEYDLDENSAPQLHDDYCNRYPYHTGRGRRPAMGRPGPPGGMRNVRAKRMIMPGGRGYSEYYDSTRAFKTSSLVSLTNLPRAARPCRPPRFPGLRRKYAVRRKPQQGPTINRNRQNNPARGSPAVPAPERSRSEEEPAAETVVDLRTYFPETWLWQLVDIGSSGREVLRQELPHTLTEWVGSAFCTNGVSGLGVSDIATVKAFQPFFVSFTLPYSVIRREKVPVLVTVFNYLTDCLVVELTLKNEPGFRFVGGARKTKVCVCGSESVSHTYHIIANTIGEVNITVKMASNGNGSKESTDVRSIRVLLAKTKSDVEKTQLEELLEAALAVDRKKQIEELQKKLLKNKPTTSTSIETAPTEDTTTPSKDDSYVQVDNDSPLPSFDQSIRRIAKAAAAESLYSRRTVVPGSIVPQRNSDDDFTTESPFKTPSKRRKIGRRGETIVTEVQQEEPEQSEEDDEDNDGDETSEASHTSHASQSTIDTPASKIKKKTSTKRKKQTAGKRKDLCWCSSCSEDEDATSHTWWTDTELAAIYTTAEDFKDIVMGNFDKANTTAQQRNKMKNTAFQVIKERVNSAGGKKRRKKDIYYKMITYKSDCRSKAAAVTEEGVCGNGLTVSSGNSARDAVTRTLIVEPEGREEEYSQSSFICLANDEPYVENFALTLPEKVVADSARGYITAIGDVMGSTISGLDKLLKIPTGCGEQNMIKFAPNIFVLQYLTHTGQLTPAIENKALSFMRVGYQRELTYRLTDGSYSAFGQSDGNGSMWLTAFVIKSFAQARPFISIDEDDLTKSIEWFKSRQLENGCFPSLGRVLHKAMKGGLASGQSPAALTAYVLIAMLDSGIDKQDRAVREALLCLRSQTMTDAYSAALIAYALSLYDPALAERASAMDRLERLAVSADGLKHWEMPKQQTVTPNHHQMPSSADVEVTSYALLAYVMAGGTDSITTAMPIVRWLTKQRNAHGGFSSTQDTVVALQALAKYAATAYSDGIAMTMAVRGTNVATDFTLNRHNKLVLQTQKIDVANNLTVTARGRGCGLFQANVRYNAPLGREQNDSPAFNLHVSVPNRGVGSGPSACKRRTITVCTGYRGPDGSSNMAIVAVKMVSGWIPEKDSIKKVKQRSKLGVKRIETDHKWVNFYFNELTSKSKCFSIIVEQDMDVENTKPAYVELYDYYDRELFVKEKYRIKRVCGTKNELPVLTREEFDKAEQSGVIEQRRMPTEPLFPSEEKENTTGPCPKCLDVPPKNFMDIFCGAKHVYRAKRGREGWRLLRDLRPATEPRFIKALTIGLPAGCACPALQQDNPHLLLLTTSAADNLQTNNVTVGLAGTSTVLPWGMETKRAVKRAHRNLGKCDI